MSLLDGKVAIITGASKGIGRVMSRLFAHEGAAVVCAARSGALVEETAALITKDGGKAVAVTGDAAKEADVKRMVAAGVKAFGKIDTLVNNAGDGGPTKKVQEYTEEDWFYTINSCLTSSYMCIRFVVPEMIKAGGGAIVNISSGRRTPRPAVPHRLLLGQGRAGRHDVRHGAGAGARTTSRSTAWPPAPSRATASTASSRARPSSAASRRRPCARRCSSARRSSAWPPPTTSRPPPRSSAVPSPGTSRARCCR